MIDILEEIMKARAESQSAHPELPVDIQIMRLREAAVRYAECEKGPRFEVGDVIFPVRDGTTVEPDMPRIVIAVRAAEYHFNGDYGGTGNGSRYDIRTISLRNGVIFPFWDESANYEKRDI